MQDLKALEGKSLAELREIAKALGIEDVMVKKRELIEKITGDSVQETPAENKGKRGRKKETPAAETPAGTAPETAALKQPWQKRLRKRPRRRRRNRNRWQRQLRRRARNRGDAGRA